MKNKALLKNDNEDILNIEWIIQSIDEGGIYEPNIKESDLIEKDINQINFLQMYSNVNKNFENVEHIQKINNKKLGPRKNILKRFSDIG